MENNQINLEQLEKKELDLRILYMFYQNVRSLCIGLSILFSFFILGQLFFVNARYSNSVAMLNGITVIASLIVLFTIKYEKLPQKYIYQTVSFIILLVYLNTLTLMHLDQEPLWLINILLMLLGVGVFVLSFRWFVFISTTILLVTIASLYWGNLDVEMQTSVMLLLLSYYFAYVANYLRINSTQKFQSMYLESQRNQNQLKMILDEFTQAKNFAETINQLVPSAIFTINLNNRITSWNNRAEIITGYRLEEMLGKRPQDVFRTDIFQIDYSDLNTAKFEQEDLLYNNSGEEIKILYSIDLLENQEFYGAIVSFEDVTERKLAEENLAQRDKILQALSVSSNIFLTKKDWQESIKLILEKYGKVLDVDRVYLFENSETDDGTMLMKYAHSWQTEKAKNLSVSLDVDTAYSYRELGFNEWLDRLLDKTSIYGNVQDIAPENKFLQGNHVSSILLVPIFANEIFWGFIGFDVIESGKSWSQMEVETLTMVADSIGAAINRQANEDYLNQMYNSLLKELDIASSVQHYLLPDWLTKQDEIIFSATYKPSSLIGGDLFDIIKLAPGKTLVYIGDISGHGVQAALMMTAVKSIINMIVSSEEEQLSPSFILQKLNKILAADLFHENYLTILLCIIDEEKDEIRYFSAGHPPLIQYDLVQKEVKIIDEGGSIPVGWSTDFDYEPEAEGVVKFASDKAFMLYTDGIFECENAAGEQFGLEGFHKFIEQHGDFTSSISLPEKFIDILGKQNYDISTDDFTLLTFKKIEYQPSSKFKKVFTIKPLLENIADIGQECNEIIKISLQNEHLADQVELLINEYLSNVISHGIEEDRPDVIGLEMFISEDIFITIWDKGIEWKLPERNSEYLRANIDRIGGFGMQIVYSIVDEIRLQRLGEMNETWMKIKVEQ